MSCEWVRVGRKRRPVALLQLTSYHGLSVLVRLSQMPTVPSDLTVININACILFFLNHNNWVTRLKLNFVLQMLTFITVSFCLCKEILQDNTILKVGIATDSDANYLQQDYGIHISSTFDLRYMATKAGCQPSNLADMATQYLNLKLDKDGQILESDWESPTLNNRQIDYAANNSFVAVELFKYFANKLKSKRLFENQSRFIKSIIDDFCLRYFDFNYRETINSKKV